MKNKSIEVVLFIPDTFWSESVVLPRGTGHILFPLILSYMSRHLPFVLIMTDSTK